MEKWRFCPFGLAFEICEDLVMWGGGFLRFCAECF